MKIKNISRHLFTLVVSCLFLVFAFGSFDPKSSQSTPFKNSIITEENNENSNEEVDSYGGLKCNHCGLGRYDENGVCDFCDAVSPSKLEKFNEKHYKSCPACNGTGWRGEELCTICEGKGKYLPF